MPFENNDLRCGKMSLTPFFKQPVKRARQFTSFNAPRLPQLALHFALRFARRHFVLRFAQAPF
jgi:hypothetical protein